MSNFRTDAINVQFTYYYLGVGRGYRGRELTQVVQGEKAFSVALKHVQIFFEYINASSFEDFDDEDFRINLEEYDKMIASIDDSYPDDLEVIDAIDSICKKEDDYIRFMQNVYILNKWGIKKEERMILRNHSKVFQQRFLYNIIREQHDGTFNKYFQTLKFIMHLIEENLKPKEQRDYFLNLKCLLGNKELQFLQYFNDFDKITLIRI